MRKGKLFAPFITLLAAAITLGVMLYSEYELSRIAWALLIVIIIFYAVGSMIANRVTGFVEANEELLRENNEEEGEVIEKEAPALDDESDSDSEESDEEMDNMFRER